MLQFFWNILVSALEGKGTIRLVHDKTIFIEAIFVSLAYEMSILVVTSRFWLRHITWITFHGISRTAYSFVHDDCHVWTVTTTSKTRQPTNCIGITNDPISSCGLTVFIAQSQCYFHCKPAQGLICFVTIRVKASWNIWLHICTSVLHICTW